MLALKGEETWIKGNGYTVRLRASNLEFKVIFRRSRPREDQPVTDQPMELGEPANQKETKFVETYLKAAENVEMTDQDVEIAENHGTEFKHESLMEYSNIQLDFIKVFGERVFVMVIGKLDLDGS